MANRPIGFVKRTLALAGLILFVGLHQRNRGSGTDAGHHPDTEMGGRPRQHANSDAPVGQQQEDLKTTATGDTARPTQHEPGNTPTQSTPSTTTPPRRKTDQELLADAQRIHAAVLMKYEGLFPGYGRTAPETGDNVHNKITVATGEFNGELVYTVNGNGTSPEARQIAEDLGYTRVHGSQYVSEGSTHAEQVMLNAYEQGRLDPPGVVAPSREYCDQNQSSRSPQGCGDRIGNTSDVRGVPFQEVWP